MYKKNRYHSRRAQVIEGISVSIKGGVVSQASLTSNRVKCVACSRLFVPAPSSEWIITAITRRDRSSIFADRTGSKFSAVQTRSLVIGFVTAWNRVNQIRDSINFDPTTTSLIKLYTFVYFAFVRNILIRVNFINQHHRRIFSFPVYNKNSVYTVLSYRNTTLKFFFDRDVVSFSSSCFFRSSFLHANYTRIERENLVFYRGKVIKIYERENFYFCQDRYKLIRRGPYLGYHPGDRNR